MTDLKKGVLLVNLGTPDEPTPSAVRRYLGEFLHDQRVVDVSRWIWCPVLHGVILRIRPPRVAKLYQSIWTDEGSPLLAISKKQQAALQDLLKQQGHDVPVALAMTYGNPSVSAGLDSLQDCDEIIVLPLYPQYCSASTASVFDAVAKAAKKRRAVPGIQFIRDYHQQGTYIDALAQSIQQDFDQHGQPDVLLMSFHGIPQRFVNEGDPYAAQCEQTAKLVADKLGLAENAWLLCYQSRFGREPWLQPYADETLKTLAGEGKSVAVICPGFAADCLETLEEIQVENKELFIEHGGKDYRYIACLNDEPQHIQMMAELVAPRLA